MRRRVGAMLLILAMSIGLAAACSQESNVPAAGDPTNTTRAPDKDKPSKADPKPKPDQKPKPTKPKPTTPKKQQPKAVVLPDNCYDVISPDAAKAALRRSLPGRVIYVKNVAIKSIKRTGRVTCSYGPAPGKDPMLQVGVSAYETKGAAVDRIAVTVQAERDAGAQVRDATVRGYPATVLLGQNGALLVLRQDRITLAVSIDKRAQVQDREGALVNVAKAVLSNV